MTEVTLHEDPRSGNCYKIKLPAALLGPGEHYALEVSGDSMIEALSLIHI